jgi:hypothetical protein
MSAKRCKHAALAFTDQSGPRLVIAFGRCSPRADDGLLQTNGRVG